MNYIFNPFGELRLKQSGQQIIGDNIKVGDLTKDWRQIILSPIIFYRREDEFYKSFNKFEGLYATLDMGINVILRIESNKDADYFIQKFYEYL